MVGSLSVRVKEHYIWSIGYLLFAVVTVAVILRKYKTLEIDDDTGAEDKLAKNDESL